MSRGSGDWSYGGSRGRERALLSSGSHLLGRFEFINSPALLRRVGRSCFVALAEQCSNPAIWNEARHGRWLSTGVRRRINGKAGPFGPTFVSANRDGPLPPRWAGFISQDKPLSGCSRSLQVARALYVYIS